MTEDPARHPPTLVFHDFHLLTMEENGTPWGCLRDGALVTAEGKIAWLGPAADLPGEFADATTIAGHGRFLGPGLIDCHTHLVYGGCRADEWERRLHGVSYEQIAREGGGILATVAATRAADEEELFRQAARRVQQSIHQGVTTFEIKSGYGLDLASELKMLRVATRVGEELPVDVVRTLLAAHAVPPEYTGRADEYIDVVCHEMIPAARDLCEAVDVFCESIAFNLEQADRVFATGRQFGLDIKVHAEQLCCLGGAALAAEHGAVSADHLEYLDDDGVRALADHRTVATLLPGAFYYLRETQSPPVQRLREHGVPIALASDANPGSSPVASLLLMANMACTFFRLTPEEAIAGLTRHAAAALRMQDRVGTLRAGKQADLVIWGIHTPAELAAGIGHNPARAVYKQGRLIHEAAF